MSQILCFGEILVDFTAWGAPPSLGEAGVFEKFSGGAPANTASALARLGSEVTMLGAVGADPFGDFLRRELKGLGVKASYIQTFKNKPTAVVFVSLDSHKVPHFHSFGRGVAYNHFRVNRKVFSLIRRSRIFHFSSISLIEKPYRAEAWKALQAARKAGLWISFDPNIRLHLFRTDGHAKKTILAAIPYAHILKLGEEELRFLFAHQNPKRVCEGLERQGVKLILITSGEKGSKYYFQGRMGRVNVFSVRAVDTTGAGDAYMAGILNRVAEQHSLEGISFAEMREMVRFASAVAALSTTRRGATTALPTVGQVRSFLKRRSRQNR